MQRANLDRRLAALERAAPAPISDHRPPLAPLPEDLGEALQAVLLVKLRASRALAEHCRAMLHDPRWLARQTPSGLAALSAWLDGSAFDLGDRLAPRHS